MPELWGLDAAWLTPQAGGGLRVALLVRDGIDHAQAEATVAALERCGHATEVLAPRLGSVLCHDGSRFPVDASLRRWPVRHFARILVLPSAGSPGRVLTSAEAGFVHPGGSAPEVPLRFLPWPPLQPSFDTGRPAANALHLRR